MKIPARRYRLTLLCLLLVLSGFTIYAHKALEATRGSQASLLARLVGSPTATARPAPNANPKSATATSAAAFTNAPLTAPGEPLAPALGDPAQSGGTFNLPQTAIAGGGGTSNGGTNSVTGTLGQSLTATSTGGSFSVAGGFWGGGGGGGCSPITVTPPATNTGTIGVNFSQQFNQTGGSGAVNFTTASTLPTDLMLATSGLLSGIPTQTGTFPITVTATDSNQCTGTANYTLTINCQTITVNLPGANTGTVGVFFSQTFTQTGGLGTVNFTLNAGTLPGGIELANNGTLSGTTAQTGSFLITVKATDANGCMGVSATYTLIINPPSCPTITVNPPNPTLPDGRAGTAYSQTFTQTGGAGAATFNISVGSLPMGLTLTGGVLSGTPTVNGIFNFTIRATDVNSCFGERAYTLLLNPPCTTITVSPATLANGFVGTAYSQTLTATGGTAPYTFAVTTGSLPSGLTLASGGALTGTPTASGTVTFPVTAMDNTGCTGTHSYTVIISGNGLQFFALPAPVRLLDTRPGASPNACSQPNAPIAGQTARTQPGRNFCTIPANAQALTGNVTTVQSGGGFLTLYPSDATQPTVASTNYGINEVINNVFTVGLGANGAFNIFANATTDVVVDVTGYYAPPATGGLYFHPLPAPVRLLETRAGQPVGCIKPGTPLIGGADSLQTATTACTGIPAAARSVVGNATTVSPAGTGYLTLYPANVANAPLVASSNYNLNQIVNGPFTVGLSNAGQFKIFTTQTTHLVVDVLGYYSPEANDANGAGLLFNPLAHPVRLLETRPGLPVGCFKPGVPLTGDAETPQTARGICDGVTIPASALGVVGNATVVTPTNQGFLTLWPSTAARPTVATSNYNPGDVGNRHFIVGLGQVDGAFKIYTQATSDLVIDLSGYFAP